MLGWIFAALTIILFLGSVIMFFGKKELSNKMERLIRIGFISAGALFICCIALSVTDRDNKETARMETEDVLMQEYTLRAMDTGTSISGGGAGAAGFAYATLNSSDNYQFLYELSDGGIKKMSISAKDTTLYELEEGSTETPRLEEWVSTTYEVTTVDESAMKYFRPFWRPLKASYDVKEDLFFSIPDTTYKAYIPAGSVITVFDVMG